MAIKKVLLSKKIGNVIYDIFPKTSAEVVAYGDSTVAATLAQFAADLLNVYNKTDADAAIKASSDALYNKIMGITAEDGTTVDEAFDTLKEVAAWISEHEGDIAAGFTADIAALKTAVGVAPAEGVEGSGLLKAMADVQAAVQTNTEDIADLSDAVEALETAVGDANSGLVKAMADAQAAITALQGTVGDENSGLVKRVTDLEAKEATKVEASETNGNVKVDGEEIVVYTHPETHAATMITQDDEHQFVTAAEKATFANAAAVVLVSSQDEVANERDLFMVEIV